MSRRLLLYVLAGVLIIALGTLLNISEARHFIAKPELWWEPVLAGGITGWLGALLGVYLILNRMVFLGLAVSQGAGLGIFTAFLFSGLFGLHMDTGALPLMLGIVFATATALLFAWIRQRGTRSEEALTGLIYILAAGMTIMIGDRIHHGHHEIDDFLLGNAVAVLGPDVLLIAISAVIISVFHRLFRRYFIYCSADEEFMRSRGIPTQRWLGLLYLTLTVGITLAVKTLGLLPVFALLLIPPYIGLRRARNMRDAFQVSLLLGCIAPPIGYYFSYLFSFPTGATIICVCGAFLLLSLIENRRLGDNELTARGR